MECTYGRYFEAPQVNMGVEATEKFSNQVLAVANIFKQQLANKIPMKRLTLEQWNECNNATNYSVCTKPFKSADKKSATTIIWQVNIEVELTMHAMQIELLH